jgi:hypothetical protein
MCAGVGCSGSGGQFTNPTRPADSVAEFGTMRGLMGGIVFVVPAEAVMDAPGHVVVTGRDDPSTFVVTVGSPASSGTRSIFDEGVSGAIQYGSSSYALYTALGKGNGAVTIEMLTATSVTGRYTLALLPEQGGADVRSILDGYFNVPLRN